MGATDYKLVLQKIKTINHQCFSADSILQKNLSCEEVHIENPLLRPTQA